MLGDRSLCPTAMSSPVFLGVQFDVRSLFQGNNIIASFHGEWSQIEILLGFWIVGAKIAEWPKSSCFPTAHLYPDINPSLSTTLASFARLAPGAPKISECISFFPKVFVPFWCQPMLCFLKVKAAWQFSIDILFPSVYTTCYFSGFCYV